VSRFVLDASTVLTWCFPDEKAQKAREVSERIAAGDTLIVPAFWRHEILNALLVGEHAFTVNTGPDEGTAGRREARHRQGLVAGVMPMAGNANPSAQSSLSGSPAKKNACIKRKRAVE